MRNLTRKLSQSAQAGVEFAGGHGVPGRPFPIRSDSSARPALTLQPRGPARGGQSRAYLDADYGQTDEPAPAPGLLSLPTGFGNPPPSLWIADYGASTELELPGAPPRRHYTGSTSLPFPAPGSRKELVKYIKTWCNIGFDMLSC